MPFSMTNVPTEFGLVTVAFVLCALIGLERQFQHKAAGVRTHALVGLGSCVFTLIGVYGFVELVEFEAVRDPGRIAAQIVSGIGFLGAGLIFINRDVVRGLTTAASIWLTAAIGIACGAGLLPLAIFATILHFVAVLLLAPLSQLIPQRGQRDVVLVTYRDGAGVLRLVLQAATELGCETMLLGTRSRTIGGAKHVEAKMRFHKGPPVRDVMTQLSEVPGVEAVSRLGRDDDL